MIQDKVLKKSELFLFTQTLVCYAGQSISNINDNVMKKKK